MIFATHRSSRKSGELRWKNTDTVRLGSSWTLDKTSLQRWCSKEQNHTTTVVVYAPATILNAAQHCPLWILRLVPGPTSTGKWGDGLNMPTFPLLCVKVPDLGQML